jgi:hypothetical protein
MLGSNGVAGLSVGLEIIQFLIFCVALIALLVGWRREVTGGVVSCVAMLTFYALEYSSTGRLPDGIVFPGMLLAGVCYIIYGLTARRNSSREPKR